MTAPDNARGWEDVAFGERKRNKYSLSNIHVVNSGSPSVKKSDLQDQCPTDLQFTEIVQGSLSPLWQ